MNESLADIEVLTLRCRSEQSKAHISEAVLCYRSGAYRATIVSVWIAVIFDLVDKIRELALAGEANAATIWKRAGLGRQPFETRLEKNTGRSSLHTRILPEGEK